MPTFAANLKDMWKGVKDLAFDDFMKEMGEKALALKVMPADQSGFVLNQPLG